MEVRKIRPCETTPDMEGITGMQDTINGSKRISRGVSAGSRKPHIREKRGEAEDRNRR